MCGLGLYGSPLGAKPEAREREAIEEDHHSGRRDGTDSYGRKTEHNERATEHCGSHRTESSEHGLPALPPQDDLIELYDQIVDVAVIPLRRLSLPAIPQEDITSRTGRVMLERIPAPCALVAAARPRLIAFFAAVCTTRRALRGFERSELQHGLVGFHNLSQANRGERVGVAVRMELEHKRPESRSHLSDGGAAGQIEDFERIAVTHGPLTILRGRGSLPPGAPLNVPKSLAVRRLTGVRGGEYLHFPTMSGHNRWSSIKHRKGAQDAKRGRVFTKIIREITMAARLGGGDASGNPRLRTALDLAKIANMPAENVTRAIKKGTGELEGMVIEELTYEGVGPGGVLVIISIMTDNRNRTASEIRKIFDKHQGQLGGSGSAAWAFEEKGLITLPASSATEEQLFEVAVGAGAEDLTAAGDEWIVTTPRDALDQIRAAIEKATMKVTEARLSFVPKAPKMVEGRDAETLMGLVESLEDNDDVQKVYAGFELTEAALQQLEQAS